MKGLDTNVLARLLVRDDAGQTSAAERFVQDNCTRESPCLVNHVVLAELAWALRSFYGYGRAEIADAVERIVLTGDFLVPDSSDVLAAVAAYRTGSADFADCLIGKLNRRFGCLSTATFDRKAGRMPEFQHIDEP